MAARACVAALLLAASLAYTFPMWSHAGIIAVHDDIWWHTRFAYEYYRAWREGQFPPLVVPLENGAARIPVFQYYSANGYMFPALLIALGANPYHAMIANTLLWCFAGSAALVAALMRLGAKLASATVCSLLFLFFPVSMMVLYPIGLYSEWVSIFALPLVFLALLRLSDGGGKYYRLHIGLTCLLIGWYIPIHPTHSFFTFHLVMLLACIHAWQKRAYRSIVSILLCELAGGLIAAWYWLPIAHDRLIVSIHTALGVLYSTGATLTDTLWPVFRPVGGWDAGMHAPQVGWYFFVAALLNMACQRRVTVGTAASFLFVSILLLVTQCRDVAWYIQIVSFFTAWDHPLLLPLGILGAIAAADFLTYLDRVDRFRYRAALALLSVCAFAGALQYPVALRGKLIAAHAYNEEAVRTIGNEEYFHGNTWHYRLHGTDFQSLDFSQPGFEDRSFPIVQDGVLDLHYILTFKTHGSPRKGCPLKILLDDKEPQQHCEDYGNGNYGLIVITPVNMNQLRFARAGSGPFTFVDFYVRAEPDAEEKHFRQLPPKPVREHISGGIRLSPNLPEGREGNYQLPIAYWPGMSILVNGQRATQQSSDLAMVVLALPKGKSSIEITNAWTLAKIISVIGLLLTLMLACMGHAQAKHCAWRAQAVWRACEPKLKHVPAHWTIGWVFVLASLVYTFPLWSEKGIPTNDILIHTRYAYEYYSAWLEGQWLPLMSPLQNNATRMPLFQYYGATGYVVPALLIAAGLGPYQAVIANITLCCLAAGLSIYAIAHKLGGTRSLSVVAGLLCVFSSKNISVLYQDALYTEWVAIFVLPGVLFALMCLVRQETLSLRYKIRLMLTSVLVAFYIPIHPIHSVFSYNLIVLLACIYAYTRGLAKSISYILLAAFAGGLMAAWYWLPIALLPPLALRIQACCWGMGDSGLTLSNLFIMRDWWYPQAAWPVIALCVATIVIRRRLTVGTAAAFMALLIIWVVTQSRDYPSLHPLVFSLFSFVQWDNRLLMVIALLGSVAVADFMVFLRPRHLRVYRVVLGVLALSAVWSAGSYALGSWHNFGYGAQYDTVAAAHIADENYLIGNSDHHAYVGTDFRDFGDLPPDITSHTYRLHHDNVPDQSYRIGMRLHAGSRACPLELLVDKAPPRQECGSDGNGNFILSADIGISANEVSFVKKTDGDVRVDDVYMRASADSDDRNFRILPRSATRSPASGGLTLAVNIPPGREGLYQLPVFYYPGLSLTVNGAPVAHASADKAMAVVKLAAGQNDIVITNGWTFGKILSLTGLLLAVGFLRLDTIWLERKAAAAALPCLGYAMRARARIQSWFAHAGSHAMMLAKARSVWLEAALVALLPTMLLWGGYDFYGDWFNHIWEIGYTAAYLRSHWTFPGVFNTYNLVGIAFPVFYGYGFFPLLGTVASLAGVYTTICVCAYGLYMVQHAALVRLLLRLDLPRWFASMAGLTVTLAIYPLTNIYNRSALPEFFAVVALSAGVIALLNSFMAPTAWQKLCWYDGALLLFALMAVTHPLTLLNGCIIMAVLCPLWWWLAPGKGMLPAMAGIPLALAPLLAPFAYAYLAASGKLDVTTRGFFNLYSDDIDWIVTRLSPWLFDRRVWLTKGPLESISTPYLDAPVNFFIGAMALLFITTLSRQQKLGHRLTAYVALLCVLFSFYIWCSVSLYPWDHLLPRAMHVMQFPYRLVTLINLIALCLLLGAAFSAKTRGKPVRFTRRTRIIGLVICLCALVAFTQKISHAAAIMKPSGNAGLSTDEKRRQLLRVPGTFWSIWNYNTPQFFESFEETTLTQVELGSKLLILGTYPLNHAVNLYGLNVNVLCRNHFPFTYGVADLYEPQPIATLHNSRQEIIFAPDANDFGDVPPVRLRSGVSAWLMTNATPFMWNTLSVDGKKAVPRVAGDRLFVYVTPGEHEINYAFTPPAMWRALNVLALCWALALVCRLLRRKR